MKEPRKTENAVLPLSSMASDAPGNSSRLRELREFVEAFFRWQGAAVRRGREHTQVELPENLRSVFGKDRLALAFSGSPCSDPNIDPVAPGSFVLETVLKLMRDRGHALRVRLPVRHRFYKKRLAAQLDSGQSSIRELRVQRVLRRHHIFYLRLNYLSDERVDQLIRIAVDEADRASLQDLAVTFAEGMRLFQRRRATPEELEQKFQSALRLARHIARDRAAELADETHERLYRTIVRLKSYYMERLAEVPKGDPARWRSATEQVDDEYAAKLAEEVENHRQRVVIRLVACEEVETPVAAVHIVLERDGLHAEHTVHVDLYQGGMEHGLCACCHKPTGHSLELCSGGHILCADCVRICASCGLLTCVVCGANECARCGATACGQCAQTCDDCQRAVCAEHSLRCGRCERNSCTTCGGHCIRCETPLCANHRATCSVCGGAVCDACSLECARCQKTLCASSAGECSVCGRVHCPQCLGRCEHCNAEVCLSHSLICESCSAVTCREHGAQCAACGSLRCQQHISTCSVCSRPLCDECAGKCDRCGSTICARHGVRCAICHKWVCKDHSGRCGTCNGAVCDDHTEHCIPCGSTLCQPHALRCGNCGELYCNRCISPNMLCTICQRLARSASVDAAAISKLNLKELPDSLRRIKKWRLVALRKRSFLVTMTAPKEILVFDAEGRLIRRRPLNPALRLRRG